MKTTPLSAALVLLAAGLATQAATAQTLPSRALCRKAASSTAWGKDLKQIPSTVIDKGVLRDIPYLSYRAGNYELNVYGDPAAPACFEIGIHKELLQSAAARKNCVDLIASLLSDPEDRSLLASLKPAGEKKVRNGITYEITPPTAEDAYGGWWVSVYNEPLLDKSRATPEELSAITTKRTDVQRAGAAADAKAPYAVDSSTQGRWASADLADARKSKDVPEEKQAVYAPTFSKKDGKYVPDRTVDDTGYIMFICANSDKHDDQEEIFKTCPACKKTDTFYWDNEKKVFIAFTCGTPYDNALIKCPTCGKVPTRVRVKH
jgi:endogenous inhibitor of DNA gyrase (YacG/DUF329 family)